MSRYEEAKLNYEKMGVDVEGALTLCAATPHLHPLLAGGRRPRLRPEGWSGRGRHQTTGDYPGRAGSFEG